MTFQYNTAVFVNFFIAIAYLYSTYAVYLQTNLFLRLDLSKEAT